MAARKKPLTIIKAELERYAERGVFGSFSQVEASGGSADFRFNWLWKLPFLLSFNAERQALVFNKLLPNVEPGSDLDASLKAFLKACSSTDRPEHRRIDRERVSVRYSNRRGAVSLTFRVMGDDYQYAVKKAVNLVNELFIGLLNVRFPEYMIKTFRLPEE